MRKNERKELDTLYKILPGGYPDVVKVDLPEEMNKNFAVRNVKTGLLLRGVEYVFLEGYMVYKGHIAEDNQDPSKIIFTYEGQHFARQGNSEDGKLVHFSTVGKCRPDYESFSLPESVEITIGAVREYNDQNLWQDDPIKTN